MFHRHAHFAFSHLLLKTIFSETGTQIEELGRYLVTMHGTTQICKPLGLPETSFWTFTTAIGALSTI